jgi:hypothetical protein
MNYLKQQITGGKDLEKEMGSPGNIPDLRNGRQLSALQTLMV